MKPYIWLIINGAVLTACAVFIYDYRVTALIAGMLFLPLLDRSWAVYRHASLCAKSDRAAVILITVCCFAIIALYLDTPSLVLSGVILTAVPEEWFFRAYYLTQLAKYTSSSKANIISSVLFGVLHIPTQGAAGLLVTLPSLVFGCIYIKYKRLGIVILLHAASNLVYISIVKQWLSYK